MNKKIVAIDFDGTIVQWQEDAHLLKEFMLMPNVKQVLDWMYQNFFCILWTCRNDEPLQNALSFLARNNIKFHAINQNAPFIDFEPSAKIYFDFCVDDRCCYCDINWLKIKQFLQNKFLSTEDIIVDKVIIDDIQPILSDEQIREAERNINQQMKIFSIQSRADNAAAIESARHAYVN